MIAKRMLKYVEGSSVTRAMFEEGKRLAALYGPENVFDFSLGNPSVEPPKAVKETIVRVLDEVHPNKVHGYMNNAGHEEVRDAIAKSLNQKFGTDFNEMNIIMTVGAAGGLNVILKTILDAGDEVIAFAPYFGEYNNYVANFDGEMVAVSPNIPSFQPNLEEFAKKITARTKAVIINTPNNPTGVVYSEETIERLAQILEDKQQEFGTAIYLIADEPYRELAYDFENLVNAATIATRILGFVNAPSLQQLVVARCLEETTDITAYDTNRKLLYHKLTELGFECAKPEGAFYMWVKALGEDDGAFVAKAKEFNLLLVPGSAFMCPGYVRIAYCVEEDMLKRSFVAFEKLAKSYGL